MKERPILFSGAMVRALLEGRKTQTRRVVKKKFPGPVEGPNFDGCWSETSDPVTRYFGCPYGRPGDRLWVREPWRPHFTGKLVTCVLFAADEATMKPTTWTAAQGAWCESQEAETRWRPSIHMPRWASRILLEVTEVRVERLQEIRAEDAIAEGVKLDGLDYDALGKLYGEIPYPVKAYAALWESINGPGSWEENPWVWVVGFERVV